METVLQFLVEQTGPVAVAMMALYFMQQNHAAYMRREADNAATHRDDKQRMFQVIEANTSSNTRLITLIERILYAPNDPTQAVEPVRRDKV